MKSGHAMATTNLRLPRVQLIELIRLLPLDAVFAFDADFVRAGFPLYGEGD